MRKILKNTLIPHKGNDYKPHLLSFMGSVVVVVFAFAVFAFGFLQQSLLHSPQMLATIYPTLVASLSNEHRAEASLQELTINPLLEEAARLKAEDMMIRGYFAHTSPTGLDPWYWITKAGYEYEYAGENLAINFSDSADVTRAWMESPGHRANILNNRFTEIGVATVKGFVNGKETVFVVEMFGTPKKKIGDMVAVLPVVAGSTSTATSSQVVATSSITIAETDFVATTSTTTAVLGASIDTNVVTRSTSSDRLFTALSFVVSNPRVIVMSLYLVLALLVLLSVSLVIVFFRHHHIGRILNGMVVLVWILFCALVYTHFFGGAVLLG